MRKVRPCTHPALALPGADGPLSDAQHLGHRGVGDWVAAPESGDPKHRQARPNLGSRSNEVTDLHTEGRPYAADF